MSDVQVQVHPACVLFAVYPTPVLPAQGASDDEAALRRQVEITLRQHGPEHPDTLGCSVQLALVLHGKVQCVCSTEAPRCTWHGSCSLQWQPS